MRQSSFFILLTIQHTTPLTRGTDNGLEAIQNEEQLAVIWNKFHRHMQGRLKKGLSLSSFLGNLF